MKRIGMILLAIVLVIAVGIGVFFTTPARTNKRILANLLEDFSDIISEYSQEKIVETKSVYGKLNGNGNGISYFGAVLVKKSAITELDALLATLDAEFEIVEAVEQKGQKVESKHLQHRSLVYDTAITDDGQYITVYFYNGSHPGTNPLDFAGH